MTDHYSAGMLCEGDVGRGRERQALREEVNVILSR